MNWPGFHVDSPLRIRALTILIFRKWFGREPNFHWHADGFMAQARDERGNCIEVEQQNLRPKEEGK
jgi:hypothetical protein